MRTFFRTMVSAMLVALVLPSCIQDEEPNTECDIVSCELPEEMLVSAPKVENDRVTLNIQPDVDISCLTPRFVLTPGATISPANGSEQDFLNAPDHIVYYTVTSEDGQWKKSYAIRVVQVSTPSDIYGFNKTELDKNDKYSIFSELNEDGEFLMSWVSGNPGFVMCGQADLKAKRQYGDAYKDHIWEFFPTSAVYPEGTIRKKVDGTTLFFKDGELAKPEYIRLVTCTTGSFGSKVGMPIAAGNIFQGFFDLSMAVPRPREATKFGEPYRYKPLKLSATYRFKAGEVFTDEQGNVVPGRKDIFSVYAIFFESDANTEYIDSNVHYNDFQHPNMVALANLTDARETGLGDGDWTSFEIDFNYYEGKTVDPEKLAKGVYKLGIVIASSAEGDYFRGAVGSTLEIKDVKVKHQ